MKQKPKRKWVNAPIHVMEFGHKGRHCYIGRCPVCSKYTSFSAQSEEHVMLLVRRHARRMHGCGSRRVEKGRKARG